MVCVYGTLNSIGVRRFLDRVQLKDDEEVKIRSDQINILKNLLSTDGSNENIKKYAIKNEIPLPINLLQGKCTNIKEALQVEKISESAYSQAMKNLVDELEKTKKITKEISGNSSTDLNLNENYSSIFDETEKYIFNFFSKNKIPKLNKNDIFEF